MKKFVASLWVFALSLVATGAHAAQPEPWQVRFQPAATGIMEQIRWFEAYTLWFIVPITLLVMVLLAWCIVRYRASANPVPSRTSHNTLIEVLWTVGPVIVLLLLAVPSFQLLTAQYTPEEEPAVTIKATGVQWYWDYEYQDSENPLSFTSLMLQDGDRAGAGKEDRTQYPRLLTVDNEVVVPAGQTVRMLVTSSDVIHAFAMPAFGIKADAVPGRINETWFKAEREGLYYGQCSELCGKDHAFMPIAIRVVSQDQYQNWYAAAQEDLGGAYRALTAAIEDGKGEDKVAAAE
ncbi:cytochrome c oxidase subunit II [Chelativorans xinjiangense]|uniref:cytochrome c oxidase subunit II n=1 Tax=Chelativorans xinjiangense TaxID=2681485 RepID=UPI0013591FFC|nr:cytochrome c oxidase subunit II [Chelativorans xinjiangense]